jgi:CRISPR-associated protein Cas1
MPDPNQRRPQAVMLSKRANVFYLEHVRVMQKDHLVVYMTEANDQLNQFISIPDKNTAFILLGKGTSITDAAVRMLAESNVIVGFCGSGGSPLFAMEDVTFLLPQDEYRPPGYAQRWFERWTSEASRLDLAKRFLTRRIDWDQQAFRRLNEAHSDHVFSKFAADIHAARSTQDLLSAEAHYAKSLYASLASRWRLEKFGREPGKKQSETAEQRANSFLDHGNYLAYGYAAVALHGLGIPYFLPVLHGKTRRGALVFDVADLFKDWLVMPAAFEAAAEKWEANRFRAVVIERAHEFEVLDHVMTFLKSCVEDCD